MRRRPTRLLTLLGLCMACTVSTAPAVAGETTTPDEPVYLDPNRPARERAVDLVSRMTRAEKAAQMVSSRAPAIPRLGVRAYGWWNEAAHGVAREQTENDSNPEILTNTTSYPVSLSMGSTWNPDLMYRVAEQVSDEAREVVEDNTLNLNFYSPTVNLGRDPRWGRNDETFSEDPGLTAAMAEQYVNGMEGKDKNGNPLPTGEGYLKTSTTLKHFAANNSEFNRRTGSSDTDERTLREYYTAPFREVIRDSSPASVMSAYNRVNGVPASADVTLLDTLARRTFGFDGFFTSDCDSVYEIQHGHHWRPEGREEPLDHVERNAYANAAGVDLNCNQGYHDEHNYSNTLPTAAEQGVRTDNGTYTENFMDASLVRMFTVRIALGEFDDPNEVPWVRRARDRVPEDSWENSEANRAVTQTPQRLALAREAAAESIVLLRNAKGSGGRRALPLNVPRSGPYSVAVIGDHADPDEMYLGGYSSNQAASGRANSVNGYQGIREAIESVNPEARVDHLPGTVAGAGEELNEDSVRRAANYDAVIVYGATDESTASEEEDRESLKLPAPQTALIERVAEANPETVVYLETIGQVDVSDFRTDVSAILWSSYNGQRKGEALADVLLGERNPSGHLPFTWYRDESQLPPMDDYDIRPDESHPGRTYMYFAGEPTYPFGHGLSYTRFEYGTPHVDRTHVRPDDTVRVTTRVTNTGETTGSDVVQLYARSDEAADPQRPDRRLVDFAKVSLRPQESERVEFEVPVRELALFDPRTERRTVEEGEHRLHLASSSSEVVHRTKITVHGASKPRPASVSTTPRAAGDGERDIPLRRIFPRDTVVEPRPTVAMSDARLYGHRADSPDLPLPAGMRIDYRSNRPEVVAVDRHGVIRTRNSGVATITATVHYRGTSTSTSFVVKVR
ncbi:glycoside hydrolase family 3 C-terminal domain-containing protein [Actinopolyspora mortivallis]|uniref:Exo-alpha-(1->6)-L-arabinopyranosidase n=1 Tax=Actinopolyspora mortivallis TaxID=33906 RepID=A0A2T0GSZ4_ACTMO|nr:glycoside hydrolase family 3 C-terminal domain-containing protein [Actinopolyspora mortivallis]PRW62235.1 family 3 glycosyl hydrolase [Actinopolyspora mortivallis]